MNEGAKVCEQVAAAVAVFTYIVTVYARVINVNRYLPSFI